MLLEQENNTIIIIYGTSAHLYTTACTNFVSRVALKSTELMVVMAYSYALELSGT